MTTVRELHDKAMELAEQAMIARFTGDITSAEAIAKDALDFERRAALLVPDTSQAEPTRSILFRSAASLAYQAKDFDEAIRLIGYGLSGHPPIWVKEELIELFEKVNFGAHL